ncbi:DUF4190 domain-containing protein [Streptomyces tubbatahanensis]|uniref:DUF4190 domain-containing protein n=1 Tax=Streptomyces tubbatahanensis TaxID=2923272 RepID=A0ABY3XQU8_9ACTN|nr:DUF4190 domain-containing protein [Streptomyces tubbatahanensis]UNS96785.1 DUF4190 domain-containing protein [Streptomyces tubbatahanensis]
MIETGEIGEEVRTAPENRAAGVSVGAALAAVIVASGSLWASGVSFYIPATIGWFAFVTLSALTAVVSGHVARRRAKRQSLPGRWWALAAIVTGWVCLLYAVLVALVVVGVLAGFAVLSGALS